jgi:Secretion system C-terminal sorting domain
MRLKMRLQPTPKVKERRAMRIILVSAGLSILFFAITFIYLNLDGKKEALAKTDSPSVPEIVSSDNIINFTASTVPQGVKITWSTSIETNNDYFTLEHSHDGVNFEALDNIDGSGNSEQTIQYNYVDELPSAGVNYYRLCEIGFDGTQKTFEPISIKLGESISKLSVVNVYPNPNGDFLITYHSDAKATTTVEILNGGGKLFYTEALKSDSGVNVYDFNSKVQLPQGIYFVQLSQGKTRTEAIRIVKK